MLIRKNTKAFKTIQQLVTVCQNRADRENLIRLYITKAGDSIKDRISIDSIEGGAALFYEMTYQTVLNNLNSSNHQLQLSDEVTGVYYFHSTSNKVWDETPFEFDEAIKKEFASMPELPLVRRKEAAGKFSLPTPVTRAKTAPAKKEKAKPVKAEGPVRKSIEQPRFGLKHDIEFTNLDKLVYRQAKVTKGDLLQYYSDVAEYILPYLKDRTLRIRLQTEGPRRPMELTAKALFPDDSANMLRWVKSVSGEKDESERLLLCNDKDHLLLYVEHGCVEFIPSAARVKDRDSADYILIGIESPDADLAKAVNVARMASEIFRGLQLPSFVKTDGASGLHVYIPAESGADFDTCQSVADYICKLIRVKVPDAVALKGVGAATYGKVSLDSTLNQNGGGVIAPYSLLAGQTPIVATPVTWAELEDELRSEEFNHESIFRRLKKAGDPFASMAKKKLDADELLERLQANYSFLL